MTDAPRPYELAWEPEAIDRLTALVHEYPEAAQAVIPAIYELGADPRPTGSTPLGTGGIRRLLLGYFRATYQVTDDPPVVRIIVVGRADRPR